MFREFTKALAYEEVYIVYTARADLEHPYRDVHGDGQPINSFSNSNFVLYLPFRSETSPACRRSAQSLLMPIGQSARHFTKPKRAYAQTVHRRLHLLTLYGDERRVQGQGTAHKAYLFCFTIHSSACIHGISARRQFFSQLFKFSFKEDSKRGPSQDPSAHRAMSRRI